MRFGMVGRTGRVMRQIVEFGDRSMARGILGTNLGRVIVTNGDFAELHGLFPNYFWQT